MSRSRVAAFLCLLILLQEFAPAQCVHFRPGYMNDDVTLENEFGLETGDDNEGFTDGSAFYYAISDDVEYGSANDNSAEYGSANDSSDYDSTNDGSADYGSANDSSDYDSTNGGSADYGSTNDISDYESTNDGSADYGSANDSSVYVSTNGGSGYYGSSNSASENLVPEPAAVEMSSKRGWAGLLWKAVKYTGKFLNTASSAASLGNAIFRAIAGCCVDFRDACRDRDEFLRMKKEIKQKSNLIDSIQLQVNTTSIWTRHGISMYGNIIQEFARIGDAQEQFITSLSPQLNVSLANADHSIMGIIKEKTTRQEGLDYLEVASMYNSAIDNAVEIGVPTLELLMPAAGKLFKKAKTVLQAKRAAKVEASANIRLRRKGAIRRHVDSVKRLRAGQIRVRSSMRNRFRTALRYGKKMLQGFEAFGNYLGTAFNLYSIINSYNECKEKAEGARKAKEAMVKALQQFNEDLANIRRAKDLVQQCFADLRGNLTADSLKTYLQTIKAMVVDVNRVAATRNMNQVAADIQTYISTIDTRTTGKQTYDLEVKLYRALHEVPITIGCYTQKVDMVEDVTGKCKQGVNNFDVLYSQARRSQQYNRNNCNSKIGQKFVTKDRLKSQLGTIARKQRFQAVCLLNNRALRSLVCNDKSNGYTPRQIVEKRTTSRIRLTLGIVQALLGDCPQVTSLSPREKRQVCNMDKLKKDDGTKLYSREDIAGMLDLDVNLVRKVVCSA